MHRLWDRFLLPVAHGCEARSLCEIGSQHGTLTRRVLEYCVEVGGVAHVIDPAPQFDVTAWEEEYGEALRFHRDLSLNALEHVPPLDLALVDGDHNWHTVLGELLLIEQGARAHGVEPPVVALHDVDWPYGRRDLYYDPETIPAEQRQPYARGGLRPGETGLTDDGLNAHLDNATHEGGQANGVMGRAAGRAVSGKGR